MNATPKSPLILGASWGHLHVAGLGESRDVKLWPGGGRPWDWSETGTHHVPGIQPADVEWNMFRTLGRRRRVRYLDEAGRRRYRLSVRSDGQGAVLHDSAGRSFHTDDGSLWTGRAIYVMDEHGDLYAAKHQIFGQFHHSSLLAGKPVAGAGTIEVRRGNIVAISRRSGHYTPTREQLQQVVDHLRSQGLRIDPHCIEWEI
jgi:hypothetical protein